MLGFAPLSFYPLSTVQSQIQIAIGGTASLNYTTYTIPSLGIGVPITNATLVITANGVNFALVFPVAGTGALNLTAETGTAAAEASTSLTLDSSASSVDSTYVGRRLRILSGSGSVQERPVTAYVGATKVATVSPRWSSNLLLWSSDPSNAAWTKTTTVTANGTYWTINDTDSVNFQSLNQSVTPVASTTYTVSIRVKKTAALGYYPLLRLAFSGGTAVNFGVALDTNTGQVAIKDSSLSVVSVIDDDDSWRMFVSGNSGNNTALQIQFYPAVGPTPISSAYAATQTGSVDVKEACLEIASDFAGYYGTTSAVLNYPAAGSRYELVLAPTLGLAYPMTNASLTITGYATSEAWVYPVSGTGSVSFTGQAPTDGIGIPVGSATALAITTYAPTRLDTGIPVTNTSLVLTANSINLAFVLPLGGTGILTLTTYTPLASAGLPVGAGSLTLTTYTPSLAFVYSVPVGSLTLTPQSVTPGIGIPVGAATGLVITGLAPTRLAFTYAIPLGTLTLTAQAVTHDTGVPVGLGPNLLITGQASTSIGLGFSIPVGAITTATYAPKLGIGVPIGATALAFTTYAPAQLAFTYAVPNYQFNLIENSISAAFVFPISGTASLTLTGYQEQVFNGVFGFPNPGSIALTTYTPSLGIAYPVGADALTLTSYGPAANYGPLRTPANASLTLTGLLPTDGFGYSVQGGSLQALGLAPSQGRIYKIPTGSLLITGYGETYNKGYIPGTGSLGFTTSAPVALVVMPIDSATPQLATYSPSLQVGNYIPVDSTSLQLLTPPSILLAFSFHVPTKFKPNAYVGWAPTEGLGFGIGAGVLALTASAPNQAYVFATSTGSLTVSGAAENPTIARGIPVGSANALQLTENSITAQFGFAPATTPIVLTTYTGGYSPGFSIPTYSLRLTGNSVEFHDFYTGSGSLTIAVGTPIVGRGYVLANAALVVGTYAPSINITFGVAPASDMFFSGQMGILNLAFNPPTNNMTIPRLAVVLAYGVPLGSGSLVLDGIGNRFDPVVLLASNYFLVTYAPVAHNSIGDIYVPAGTNASVSSQTYAPTISVTNAIIGAKAIKVAAVDRSQIIATEGITSSNPGTKVLTTRPTKVVPPRSDKQ